MRFDFCGCRFDLKDGWHDITDDTDTKGVPTLAKDGGVGAMQFSVYQFTGGQLPEITTEELETMLLELCDGRELYDVERNDLRTTRVLVVGAVGKWIDAPFGAWYVTDSRSVALITYTSVPPDQGRAVRERTEVIDMIRTLELPPM